MIKTQIQYGLIASGILLLIILVFSTVTNNGIINKSETVQLTAKQVQRSINRSFPLLHTDVRFNFKLNNPKLILKEGWQYVAINLDLNMAVKQRRANRKVYRSIYQGKVTLSGSLDYSPNSGNIVLNKIKLRVLDSSRLKAVDIAKIESSLVAVLQDKLNRHPIYRLKGKQFKQKIDQLTLSNVEVGKNNISLELALK